MRSAYICHPLRGKTGSPEEIKSNLERIDEICKNLAAIYPDVLLLSPLHAFSFYDPRGPQNQVLGQCVAMLEKSDELWAFGDYESSEGCMKEIAWAEEHCIPVAYCAVGDGKPTTFWFDECEKMKAVSKAKHDAGTWR